MQSNHFKPLLLIPALLTGWACAVQEPTSLGSIHVKSGLIDAATGGTIEVTAEDDYAPFVGTKVVIPAGALTSDTKITIDVYSSSLMDDDAEAAGPAVDLGPDGTIFSKPVQITVPLTEGVDAALARVYVRHGDGSRDVIVAADITVDIEAKLMHFSVQHFTTYHPGRARGPCRHVMCASGETCNQGRCVPPAQECTSTECAPAPGAPNYICPDGTIAGPVCERDPAGSCGWNFLTCAGTCSADGDCATGEECINGTCAVSTGSCGDGAACGAGQYCCNPSCGICAPLGSNCTQQACATVCQQDSECASSETCVNGQCVAGQPCGNNVCGPGDSCCNASCGICTAPGQSCTQQFCGCAMDSDCPTGDECQSGQCVTPPPGGEPCGTNTCGAGTVCCNAACGMCAAPNVACTQQACDTCASDRDCISAGGDPSARCVDGYCM